MPPRFRPGNISDPVHGYIAFTGLERELFDHFATQRLRRVSQTGLGDLVYPELRGVRFSHCLGAMHLASSFLTTCLKNSDTEVLEELTGAILSAVRREGLGQTGDFYESREVPQIWDIEGVLQAYRWYEAPPIPSNLDETRRRQALAVTEQRRRALAVTEQALRLTTLFHDLGHLPFSHDFEFALDAMSNDHELEPRVRKRIEQLIGDRGKDKFHEVIGPEIGHLILRDVLAKHKATDLDRGHYLAVFRLAYAIWKAEEPWDIRPDDPRRKDRRYLALCWLKSLVSGQLDVDRCDYILRDGRNYGFDFAGYNLERLLGQLVVAKKDQDLFVLAVRPQGVGFLESFVLSRYRSYQFGVLHHKVSQVAAALQYSIAKTLGDALGIVEGSAQQPQSDEERLQAARDRQDRAWASQFDRFLKDLAWIIAYREGRQVEPQSDELSDGEDGEAQVLRRFATYDDVWWTFLMRQRYGLADDDPWLALILWRKPGPRSLWKRPDDFLALLHSARDRQPTSPNEGPHSDFLPSDLRTWNARLPSRRPIGAERTSGEARWDDTVRKLHKQKNVLVLHKRVRPFELVKFKDADHSDGLYVNTNTADGVRYLTEMSPLARALAQAWKDDLQLQAFAVVAEQREEEVKETAIKVISDLWEAMPQKAPGSNRRGDRRGGSSSNRR